MQTFLNSASAVMLILMLTAVGYFLGQAGWMKHEHKTFIVKYIMNIALPCMCVNNILSRIDLALLHEMRTVLLISLCSILSLLALSYPAARLLKLPRARQGVFMVMCFVANSMFIGYPMCTAIFGDAAVPYVLAYFIVNTIFFQFVGVALLSASGHRRGEPFHPLEALKKLARPPIIAIVVSIALVLLDLKLPPLLLRFASYSGNTVSALGLLYTGFVMYELVTDGGEHRPALHLGDQRPALIVMLLFRYALAPLCCVLFCALFGLSGAGRGMLLIETSMPVMTQSVLLSAEYGADEQFAAVGVTLSTLACFIMIPILTALC